MLVFFLMTFACFVLNKGAIHRTVVCLKWWLHERVSKTSVICYLFSQVTNQMQDKIDNRLNWLTRHLGGTGDKLVVVTTCLMHAGYFLLATLCILFLNAPLFTRLVLLVAIPINAWSEINFDSSLSYSTLSSIISVALLGKYWHIIILCLS